MGLGRGADVVFFAFVSLIAPVYIAPLFNKYNKLEDARIKDPILSMARANGIPATDVYEFDASRQSDRVSANVSGFASTHANFVERQSPETLYPPRNRNHHGTRNGPLRPQS